MMWPISILDTPTLEHYIKVFIDNSLSSSMVIILSRAYLLSVGRASLQLTMHSEGHRESCNGSQSDWAVLAPSRTPVLCLPLSALLLPPEEEMMELKYTRVRVYVLVKINISKGRVLQ